MHRSLEDNSSQNHAESDVTRVTQIMPPSRGAGSLS